MASRSRQTNRDPPGSKEDAMFRESMKSAASTLENALSRGNCHHAFSGDLAIAVHLNPGTPIPELEVIVSEDRFTSVLGALNKKQDIITVKSSGPDKICIDVKDDRFTVPGTILREKYALGDKGVMAYAPHNQFRVNGRNIPIFDFTQLLNMKLYLWSKHDRGTSDKKKDARDIYLLVSGHRNIRNKDLDQGRANAFCKRQPAGLSDEEFKVAKRKMQSLLASIFN